MFSYWTLKIAEMHEIDPSRIRQAPTHAIIIIIIMAEMAVV